MKFILYICALCLLSACQLSNFPFVDEAKNAKSTTQNTKFSDYYLQIKELDESNLVEEISLQKISANAGNLTAEIKLILLYSLPGSPIHNPYTAKSMLNEQLINDELSLSGEDFALFSLLKDQLNQQLLLFQKLIEKELAQDQQNKVGKKQLVTIKRLNEKISQFSQQIEQLKNIESAINDRGN